MKKTGLLALIIILAGIIASIAAYPLMPGLMASHWNAEGRVDGFMTKEIGLALMPLMSIALLALFKAIPRIDPLKKNIEKFKEYFDGFIALILLFLLFIHLLVIAWNLGYRFDFIALMAPALGALFYFTGVMLKRAKRNWFIGFRTPWTLSNERVWNKTHAKAGRLFTLAGVIALFGAVFKEYALWLIMAPVIAFSAYLLVYSWLEYRKTRK